MNKLFVLLLSISLMAVSCSDDPEVIKDLGETSFQLVDQDSTVITFPAHFEGKYVVMGFIYTNCPDICSLITQNLLTIQDRLGDPEDVTFVAATFDPERDRPSILKNYGEAFNTNDNFTFLTGDSTEVFALMDSVGVRSRISFTQEREDGEDLYFLNHSDKILVIDPESRVIIDYGGSQKMIPSLIVEDLKRIR